MISLGQRYHGVAVRNTGDLIAIPSKSTFPHKRLIQLSGCVFSHGHAKPGISDHISEAAQSLTGRGRGIGSTMEGIRFPRSSFYIEKLAQRDKATRRSLWLCPVSGGSPTAACIELELTSTFIDLARGHWSRCRILVGVGGGTSPRPFVMLVRWPDASTRC